MFLEVLHVPGCPHVEPLMDRLRDVTDLPVPTREVRTAAEAARSGMAGSPTLLIDGVDPFVLPGEVHTGVSCRLYRDQQGHIVSAPSADQLRTAIASARARSQGTD